MGDVPGTKVWVGNLGSTCEERDLRDEFSKFGELNKVGCELVVFFGCCHAGHESLSRASVLFFDGRGKGTISGHAVA